MCKTIDGSANQPNIRSQNVYLLSYHVNFIYNESTCNLFALNTGLPTKKNKPSKQKEHGFICLKLVVRLEF